MLRAVAVVLLGLVLSACGGGGDDAAPAVTSPTTQSAPAGTITYTGSGGLFPFIGQARATSFDNRTAGPLTVDIAFSMSALMQGGPATARISYYYRTNGVDTTVNIPLIAGTNVDAPRTYQVVVPPGDSISVQALAVLDAATGPTTLQWQSSAVTFTPR